MAFKSFNLEFPHLFATPPRVLNAIEDIPEIRPIFGIKASGSKNLAYVSNRSPAFLASLA